MNNTNTAPNGVPLAAKAPYPGQPDKEVLIFLHVRMKAGSTMGYAARQYSNALRRYRPAFEEGNWVREKWEAEELTELQRKVLEAARRDRASDPKWQADMKRKDDAERAEEVEGRREFQRSLYAIKVGRPIRRYRKSDTVTAEERAADQKQQTEALNKRIRDDLENDKNPYDLSKIQNWSEAGDKLMARHYACNRLFKDGSFDPKESATIAAFVEFLENHPHGGNVSAKDAERLLSGAQNSLRAARVVTLKKGVAILHPEIAQKRETKQMESIEIYGAY
ncbi:hypothetical protein [Paracoccus benzoatiresistens]|uniref:Uncharacterized protein n=1 Tax=Paracoccus benzoatiresistens TaxID=2997341 RepID=A0ABT4JBB7_9RHOB|nr:hypothetical protein [Paracoccus sp. EF6]MCZ0963882.1 hypothetical protein [Paracoccus sp. EF6]